MSEELINKIIIYNFHEFGDEFGNALVGLQQENQQLKEENNKLEMKIIILESYPAYPSLVMKYKSILDEIREYCNLYTRLSAKDILQILDKVKE